MEAQHIERKLAAILSADVKGYSRLMGADEEATLRTLTAYRDEMDAIIRQHRGRVVGSAGDSVLAEFASVVDAVQCAVVIQATLKAENTSLPLDRRMEFRIGINLGDVMVRGEQVYDDGVNIAARLEGLAEPGGISISGTVYDQVKNKLALEYEYLGEQEVKNITETASPKISPPRSRKFPVCSLSLATPPSLIKARPSRCRTSGGNSECGTCWKAACAKQVIRCGSQSS